MQSASTISVLHSETSEPVVAPVKQRRRWYEKHPNRTRNYAILVATFALYMIICVCFYTYYEGWDASVSLSFVVETMTTVGKTRFRLASPISPRVYHFE